MRNVDEDGNPVLMASAGNVVVPFDSFTPVRIAIDGEFVGHALFGFNKVSPVFVLPSGQRKFSFTCDGFVSVNNEIRVLGTGSTQYLIVKLFPVGADNFQPKSTRQEIAPASLDGE